MFFRPEVWILFRHLKGIVGTAKNSLGLGFGLCGFLGLSKGLGFGLCGYLGSDVRVLVEDWGESIRGSIGQDVRCGYCVLRGRGYGVLFGFREGFGLRWGGCFGCFGLGALVKYSGRFWAWF